MRISTTMKHEIEVLAMFDLSSMQVGIKVHHDADEAIIAATESLFEKGLITQKDGGYLTSLGHDAAEHAQNLITILDVKPS